MWSKQEVLGVSILLVPVMIEAGFLSNCSQCSAIQNPHLCITSVFKFFLVIFDDKRRRTRKRRIDEEEEEEEEEEKLKNKKKKK